MEIQPLAPGDEDAIAQAAALLVEAFPRAWPDQHAATEEVRASFDEGRISLVAASRGEVLGWIGAIAQYDGRVWELHPLVVRADQRGRGIGRALVGALEAAVQAQSGLTVLLGTDDEADQTSLSGVTLYPDPWTHVARIQNLRGHPYEFYQKLGYTIVGVVPDANGPGKPDILMAKSVAGTPSIQDS